MDDEFDEVIAEFLVESHENLDRLDQDLLALESNPEDPSTLGSAFRTIHTIKGTCGFLGFSHLERVAHVGENLLSRLRDGVLRLDEAITTALLEMVDAIRAMLAEIESTGADGQSDYDDLVAVLSALQQSNGSASGEPAASEPTGSEPAASDADTAGRDGESGLVAAPVGDLLVASGATHRDDVALALAEQDLGDSRPIGQILIDHGSVDPAEVEQAVFTQQTADAGAARATPGAAPEGKVGISESTIRVDVGVLDRLMNLVGELVLSRNNIVQNVGRVAEPSIIAASQQLDLITGELQECVMKTRMQPIGTVWSKFSRVVRDLSIQCGKQVRIEMEGEETELDKTILEAIKDPLTHVVRNTVDHGIEAPDVRLAAGKPAEGVLLLRARHEGGLVIIEIADDGAGIDTTRVKAKAVSRGLITDAQAAEMTEREAVHLIFSPGFSTAETVTNVSGRGVGMDVVKTNIERIGGAVDVDSALGAGTTLRIKIPLTLAIVPALMVDCAGHRYAIPQIEVQELVRLDGEQALTAVEMLHNAPVHRLRGDLLPLVDLREQLGLEPAGDDPRLTIAVVATDNRPWGLVVDGVSTTEEIVVKPLGSMLRSVPAFSGATIMGDGRISLILDIARIARQAQVVATAETVRREQREVTTASRDHLAKVLVVGRGEEQVGIELARIERLEQFALDELERSDQLDVIQYRDGILPLVWLGAPDGTGHVNTVVFERDSRLVGLVVERIVDIVDASLPLDATARGGTIVVRGRVTEMLDIDAALSIADAWLDRNLMGVGA